MDIKNFIIGSLSTLVLILAGVFLLGASEPQPGPREQSLGALTGPDISSQYLSWGGVRIWQFADVMDTASTTCSFLTPPATTTLAWAAAGLDAAPIGATLPWEWGKAANEYATTTSLGVGYLASGASGTILASTTGSFMTDAIDEEIVFSPSTYLNLKVGSSSPNSVSGACYVQFMEVQ